jgi:2-C-methyl-D-erythritol 4-phosphate cytidylyltransferase
MDYSVVLLAAGSGSRMKLGYNKMFIELHSKPIVTLSMSHFYNDFSCKEIIVVVNEQEVNLIHDLLLDHQLFDSRCKITIGGRERQFSVNNGLKLVNHDIVLIHDAARPFINQQLIKQLVLEADQYGCVIPGVKVKDTIKVIQNGMVQQTLNRSSLIAVQTPQACKTQLLKEAHQLALTQDYLGTDDASLIEYFNLSTVKVMEGNYDNIKITTQEDIDIAKNIYPHYFEKE